MLAVGTPSACFLPARRYEFSYLTGLVELSVPIRGVFPADSSKPGAEYDVVPEEGQVMFGTLLEALFAFRKYPSLDDGQYFVISGVETADGCVTVLGRIVEIMK